MNKFFGQRECERSGEGPKEVDQQSPIAIAEPLLFGKYSRYFTDAWHELFSLFGLPRQVEVDYVEPGADAGEDGPEDRSVALPGSDDGEYAAEAHAGLDDDFGFDDVGEEEELHGWRGVEVEVS